MRNIFTSEHEHIGAGISVIKCSEGTRNEYCHNGYELIYFLCGNGKYIVEGKEYSITEKSVLALRPLAYHCITESNEDIELISILFDSTVLNSEICCQLNNILPGDQHSRFYFAESVPHAVVSAFDRLELARSLPADSAAEFLKAIATEIIVFLSTQSDECSETPEQELGARVLRHINANINKNLSLDKLARRFFVSKYYLCRAFKKYSGTSVHSYINHKRIMYAKQLIESGLTASKAAYEVGFGDYSAFYRAYVKILGKSPTAD